MVEDTEDAMMITEFGKKISSPVDTAAASTWINGARFKESGKRAKLAQGESVAAERPGDLSGRYRCLLFRNEEEFCSSKKCA